MKQYVAYCVGNFFTFFVKNPLFWSDRFVFWFLYTAKFMIDIFFSVCLYNPRKIEYGLIGNAHSL